jgi:hypothetical protein
VKTALVYCRQSCVQVDPSVLKKFTFTIFMHIFSITQCVTLWIMLGNDINRNNPNKLASKIQNKFGFRKILISPKNYKLITIFNLFRRLVNKFCLLSPSISRKAISIGSVTDKVALARYPLRVTVVTPEQYVHHVTDKE